MSSLRSNPVPRIRRPREGRSSVSVSHTRFQGRRRGSGVAIGPGLMRSAAITIAVEMIRGPATGRTDLCRCESRGSICPVSHSPSLLSVWPADAVRLIAEIRGTDGKVRHLTPCWSDMLMSKDMRNKLPFLSQWRCFLLQTHHDSSGTSLIGPEEVLHPPLSGDVHRKEHCEWIETLGKLRAHREAW